jgi:uncharacterized protein (DUF1330 family)
MAKAYWIICYRFISDPAARDAYTKLAVPAVLASGGRFLARGLPARTYEGGIDERTVLVEFDSLDLAIAAQTPPAPPAQPARYWPQGLSVKIESENSRLRYKVLPCFRTWVICRRRCACRGDQFEFMATFGAWRRREVNRRCALHKRPGMRVMPSPSRKMVELMRRVD